LLLEKSCKRALRGGSKLIQFVYTTSAEWTTASDQAVNIVVIFCDDDCVLGRAFAELPSIDMSLYSLVLQKRTNLKVLRM
jgi:hypothetical protein